MSLSPTDFVAGKSKLAKLTLDDGTDVSSLYELSYIDLDTSTSELSISKIGDNSTIVPTISGRNYKILATNKVNQLDKKEFFININPGSVSKIVNFSEKSQGVEINLPLSQPLKVKAIDSKGNPVPGVVLSWAIDNGSANWTETITGEDGFSQNNVISGSTPGVMKIQVGAKFNQYLKLLMTIQLNPSSDPNNVNKIKISQLPNSLPIGSSFSIAALALNTNSDIVGSASGTMNVSMHTNSTCSSSAITELGGEKIAEVINGQANFSQLSHPTPGKFFLKISYPGTKAVCSKPIYFYIPLEPNANKLVFVLPPPAKAIKEEPFKFKVAIQDASNQIFSEGSRQIQVSAYSDPGCVYPSNFSLASNVSIPSVEGIATFSGISFPEASVIYLKVVSNGLVPICSKAIQIYPNSPSRIKLIQLPIESRSGLLFPTTIKALIYNELGKIVAFPSLEVKINGYKDSNCSLSLDTPLVGKLNEETNSGVASFSNLSYSDIGDIYVQAEASGIKSPCSPKIGIKSLLPNSPIKVKIVQEPQITGFVDEIIQPITVELQNQAGIKVLNSNNRISLSLYSDEYCYTQVQNIQSFFGFSFNGEVNFPKIKINRSGRFYFKASSGLLQSDCSNPINIIPHCGINEHIENYYCVENVKSCLVNNGTGVQTWNNLNSSYGECVILSCQNDFHKEAESCVSNIKSCVVDNGIGQKIWEGTNYSLCTTLGCNQGFDLISGQCYSSCLTDQHRNLTTFSCDSNILDCTAQIENSSYSTKGWNHFLSEYGSCAVQSCNDGFHIEAESCLANTKSCLVSHGAGSQSWNQIINNYGSCVATACDPEYHLENGSCYNNSRSCDVLNGVGQQNWVGSQWESACTTLSCNQNFDLIQGSCFSSCLVNEHRNELLECINNTVSCFVQNGTGEQFWNGDTYGSCQIVSCNLGFSLINGIECVDNDRPAISMTPNNFNEGQVSSTLLQISLSSSIGIQKIKFSNLNNYFTPISISQDDIFLRRGLDSQDNLVLNQNSGSIIIDFEGAVKYSAPDPVLSLDVTLNNGKIFSYSIPFVINSMNLPYVKYDVFVSTAGTNSGATTSSLYSSISELKRMSLGWRTPILQRLREGEINCNGSVLTTFDAAIEQQRVCLKNLTSIDAETAFFFPTVWSGTKQIGGIALGTRNGFVVEKFPWPHTLSHELGHNLGLFHTFETFKNFLISHQDSSGYFLRPLYKKTRTHSASYLQDWLNEIITFTGTTAFNFGTILDDTPLDAYAGRLVTLYSPEEFCFLGNCISPNLPYKNGDKLVLYYGQDSLSVCQESYDQTVLNYKMTCSVNSGITADQSLITNVMSYWTRISGTSHFTIGQKARMDAVLFAYPELREK